VNNDPISYVDPFGLVEQRFAVGEEGYDDIDKKCASSRNPNSRNPAGACSKVSGAAVFTGCHCEGDGYQPNEFIFLVQGTIYYYNGPNWPYKNRRPHDSSVIDAPSAIAHEWGHIHSCTDSASKILEAAEKKIYDTPKECEDKAKDARGRANRRFWSCMREQQNW
jgi:hypothetical protein